MFQRLSARSDGEQAAQREFKANFLLYNQPKQNINRNFIYFRIHSTSAAYSNDALRHKEAPIVENDVILSKEEMQEREKLSHLVSLPKEVMRLDFAVFEDQN